MAYSFIPKSTIEILDPAELETRPLTELVEELKQAEIRSLDGAAPSGTEIYLSHYPSGGLLSPDRIDPRPRWQSYTFKDYHGSFRVFESHYNQRLPLHATYIGQTHDASIRRKGHREKSFTRSDLAVYYASLFYEDMIITSLATIDTAFEKEHPLLTGVVLFLLESILMLMLRLVQYKSYKEFVAGELVSNKTECISSLRYDQETFPQDPVNKCTWGVNLQLPIF